MRFAPKPVFGVLRQIFFGTGVNGMEKKFDFDELIDRRNSGSLKWDVKENELPMWVADMDFRTAPGVVKAIEARAKTGIYGYAALPDRWYDAVISWWERRHGFRFGRDWLCFCTASSPPYPLS